MRIQIPVTRAGCDFVLTSRHDQTNYIQETRVCLLCYLNILVIDRGSIDEEVAMATCVAPIPDRTANFTDPSDHLFRTSTW